MTSAKVARTSISFSQEEREGVCELVHKVLIIFTSPARHWMACQALPTDLDRREGRKRDILGPETSDEKG